MSLTNEQNLISSLKRNPNITGIKILASAETLQKRFNGSISKLFRALKNGKNSISAISNREYFKNFTGCYFFLKTSNNFELILLYDTEKSKLTPNQVKTRIKKIIGITTSIEFGNFNEYEKRITEILQVKQRIQTFGDYYFTN
jgi:hypothetical protein